MATGMHFYCFGSLRGPVPVPLIPVASVFNWYMKAWKSFWSLMARRKALNSLVSGRFLLFLVLDPSIDDLVLPTSPDEFMVRFP